MPTFEEAKTEVVNTDVVVIGGGIAGCFAAIEARKHGLDVVLVDKGHAGRSGLSPMMSGGLTYFDPEQDNYQDWFNEIVEAGEWLSEQDYLKQEIHETTQLVRDMDRWGVKFQKEGNKFVRKLGAGMMHPMSTLLTNSGFQMMSVMRGKVLEQGARLVERVMVTDLLTSDGELPTQGRIAGAVGFHTRNGRFYVFKAKAVIIATGITGALLRPVLAVLSGDGRGMAFRAGVEMKNIELTLLGVHPLGLNCAPGLNIFNSEGAYWLNANGERFLKKRDAARMERIPRTMLGEAMLKEQMEGRGPVYLDATHLSENSYSKLEQCIPIVLKSFNLAGLDVRKDRITYDLNPIDLCAGGIRVDMDNATNIPGLYAAGDASDHGDVGVTDGIRPGITAAVGGYRAAKAIAGCAREVSAPEVHESQIELLRQQCYAPLKRDSGLSHREVRTRCVSILKSVMPPRKNERNLKKAIQAAREIKESELPKLVARDYHELSRCIGLGNEFHFVELFPRCSLLRTESRGSHLREDYPERDDANWLKWVIAKKENDDIKVWAEPVPFEKYPLKPKPSH
ncbi:FAD-dependent oxidoreductase [Chloroflexota bacterium]